MSLLVTILKTLSSMVIAAGSGMLVMGLGIVDVDPKLGAVARVYTDPLRLPLQPVLIVVGLTKILSALRLWDVIRLFPRPWAFVGNERIKLEHITRDKVR